MIEVEMCQHYNWINRPTCTKGHKASLKCHSKRESCKDYEPSWHYGKDEPNNDERRVP